MWRGEGDMVRDVNMCRESRKFTGRVKVRLMKRVCRRHNFSMTTALLIYIFKGFGAERNCFINIFND